jgi:hypothetical protein
MPLHRGAPPPRKVRWALPMLERKRLMAAIIAGVQKSQSHPLRAHQCRRMPLAGGGCFPIPRACLQRLR